MRIVRFLLFLASILVNLVLYSQDRLGELPIEELKSRLNSAPSDTVQIRLLNTLAMEYYYQSQFDSCQFYASHALRMTDSLLGTIDMKNHPESVNPIKILKAHAISRIALGYQTTDTYKKVDTLQFALKLVSETGNKNEIAAIYATLGDVYIFRNQLQLAEESYLKSVEIYKQTGNKTGQARELTGVAITERSLGNYGDALEHLMESLNLSRRMNDSLAMTDALLAMGFTYMHVEKWEDALNSQQEALEIYTLLNDSLGIATVFNDMGVINMQAGRLDLAIRDHQAALAIRLQSTDYFYTSSSYDYLGSIYEDKEMYPEAISNYTEALRYGLMAGYIINIIDLNLSLGELYLKLPDHQLAMKHFTQAFELSRENDDPINEAIASMHIAGIYSDQNKNQKALEWLQHAENVVPKSAFVYLEDIYDDIARTYFQLGHYKKAYANLMLSGKIKDSLVRAENIEKITTLSNRLVFENEQKLQNESHNKILQLNLAEIRRQKIVRNASLLGMFVVLILAIIFFVRFVEKKKLNTKLQQTVSDLKATQAQLIHAEKMASLGELTAGVAHEIQNPLNFVNNFSEVSVDLINDLVEEINIGHPDEVKSLIDDLKMNLEKITHHGKRASSIVNGMLDHSRKGSGQKEPTDINHMADEYLRLAFHGYRAKDKSFSAAFETNFDQSLTKLEMLPQEMGRVLLNLINNAFYAVNEKKKKLDESGDQEYRPLVEVSTKAVNGYAEIRIKDNGKGIPDELKEKIFQPFFTTKPSGEGTGLGLSLSYDIVTKGHGGVLAVETIIGKGTTFIIQLPLKRQV